MNSTSFKFMGAMLLLSVAFVFSCKVADAGATADTGTTMHTVTIVLNGGMGVSDEPQKVEDGKTFTIGNPSKAGFVFKGWSTNNTLSNLDFTSGNYAIKQDITIYAMFNKLYTVTINANDGTSSNVNVQVEAGASYTLTEMPKKALYTFNGYSDGTKTYTLNNAFVVNGDMTLTAQWSADLIAIKDILTGGTTTGLRWMFTTNNNTYLDFKVVTANSLTIGYNWFLLGDGSPANSTTTITESDDPNFLAKLVPPPTTLSAATPVVYYISSLNETTLNVSYKSSASTVYFSTASYTKQ